MQVAGISVLLLRLDVPLALLTIAAAVPILVLCHRFTRAYHEVVRRIQDQTGDLTTTIEEAARGISVLKAFGRAREAFQTYDAQARHIHRTQIERIRLHTKFIWVLTLIPNITVTAILLAGALSVGSGRMTIGGLVAFIAYALMLTWPIEALGWIMAMAEEAETAAGRVWEVFDTEPAIRDKDGAATIGRAVGEVRFDNVVFHYPGSKRTVLRGLDLVIHPGETMALVGATGSGKTTVATLLARLYDPTAGRVTLDGYDLRDLTVNSVRRQIGFAFEEPSLFSASVRENLLIGKPDATEEELLDAIDVAQAHFAHDLPWGSTRASASRASRCRAVNASASRSRDRSSPGRGYSCSTIPSPRSTCTPSRWSRRGSDRSSLTAPRWSSSTARRRSRSPIGPRSSRAAVSSRPERTMNLWSASRATAPCSARKPKMSPSPRRAATVNGKAHERAKRARQTR